MHFEAKSIVRYISKAVVAIEVPIRGVAEPAIGILHPRAIATVGHYRCRENQNKCILSHTIHYSHTGLCELTQLTCCCQNKLKYLWGTILTID